MARLPPALLVVGVLLLAGCIKGDDAPAAGDANLSQDNATAPSAALPDGRGESAGLKETSVTEEGVGGVEHLHDYWKGKEQVVLYRNVVEVSCPPCMPDGESTQPKSVAYVKLGRLPDAAEDDALVYEGANKVELLFGAPLLPGPSASALAHPSPPKLFVQWRSAADSKWNDPKEVAPGSPLAIDVTPQMTDMPHSTRSLWVFRVTTDRAEINVNVPLTITVFKGRDVVDWPGHPDFYADNKTHRVVMQQHVTTHMSGLESAVLYDSGGTWATPEKLVSWGTKQIHVFINVTKVTNAYNADATGIFLEAHNATIIGPEITFGSRHFDESGAVKETQYFIKVDEAGMDGPYQPESRWGFRAMATFAEIPGVTGLCPGCFPYDIEYDIIVIASRLESRAD